MLTALEIANSIVDTPCGFVYYVTYKIRIIINVGIFTPVGEKVSDGKIRPFRPPCRNRPDCCNLKIIGKKKETEA